MQKSIIFTGLLLLSFAFNVKADDSDRINQLEQEIQGIKLRLSKLEAPSSNPSTPQEAEISSDGWKSITNWRKLTKGMGTSDAQKILGEPYRVEAATYTRWYYQNSGIVTFYEGKIDGWQEPRR